MKKVVVVLVMVLSGMLMTAQTPPMQRDTIVGREVTYHYIPQWVDPGDSVLPEYYLSCFLVHEPTLCCPAAGYTEYAELHVVDTPLTIIGLAVCPKVCTPSNTGGPIAHVVVNDTDWRHTTEKLRLYVNGHVRMTMVREEEFDLVDTTRWMEFCDSGIHANESHPDIFPVVERYFEKPYVVQDTFYVAVTHFNQSSRQNQDYSLDHWPMSYQCCDGLTSIGHQIYRPAAYRYDENGPWIFVENWIQVFLFAIFDTTGMGLSPQLPPCSAVDNLAVAAVWGNNVMLTWDGAADHRMYEIGYGFADNNPDSYSSVTSTTTSVSLRNLHRGVKYAARVRARCEDGENYSEWSDTVQFMLTGEQPEVIAGVADKYTYVVPNPAGESVTVASSFELRSVEVYDMNGRQVWGKECTGLAVTVDVSDWAEGTYIVVIHNLQGTATKKLVVER